MRSLFVVALLAAPVAAQPKPTRFTMQATDSTNLHIAGGRGAMHWTDDIKVTVDLLPAGRVEAVVAGTKKEHDLDVRAGQSFNSDELTTFAIKWSGAWSEAPGKLTLDLTLANERCTHTRTMEGAPPETMPCRRAAKAAQLVCTLQDFELFDFAKPAVKQKVPAWSCSAKNFDDLGESPGWILGVTTCIKTSGGHHTSLVFEKC